MTVVRRSRRYRRDERHEFDPGPCPDCGATGRFTVTWIAASISGEDPADDDRFAVTVRVVGRHRAASLTASTMRVT